MHLCRVKGCRKAVDQDGLCPFHFDQRRANGTCVIDGCENAISRQALGWCEMHYYRHYRHGDTAVETVRPRTVLRRIDRGYVLLWVPGHPLAHNGWVYEHRLVLYEHLGPGPRECWWCGVEVRWDNGLQIDHLDHDRGNNDPANLVTSCQACNLGRGAGCDPKGWAIAMATRRILRRHSGEFLREVGTMRARLEAVPYSGKAKGRRDAATKRNAARAAFDELTGNARGRWQKRPPGG